MDMNLDFKKRSVWNFLGYVLARTLAVVLIFLIIVAIVESLNDVLNKWPLTGRWWKLLTAGFIVSLIYEWKLREYRYRHKTANAFVFYLQNKSSWKSKIVESHLKLDNNKCWFDFMDRLKIYGNINPILWHSHYMFEEYPDQLFDIVDNYISTYEEMMEGAPRIKPIKSISK